MAPAKTGKEQGRFRPGASGNPSGRPQGSRNRATLAVEALLDGEAEKLTRKAIDMALAGDPTALRICMERIIPKRHERSVVIDLPEISETADAAKALSAVITATAGGELTPSEARSIGALLSAYATLRSPNGVDVGHALEAETAITHPLASWSNL
jgi:hypothetical protein